MEFFVFFCSEITTSIRQNSIKQQLSRKFSSEKIRVIDYKNRSGSNVKHSSFLKFMPVYKRNSNSISLRIYDSPYIPGMLAFV